MAETDFKLPYSSFTELKKLLIAFAKSKNPCALSDLNKLTSIPQTSISTNNGFLESIGAISGGKKKEGTEKGKKLGIALANNMEDEASRQLHSLLMENEFLESMITALGIKPRSNEDFQSHIAYSLGRELKGSSRTGTGAVIEMLLFANLIEEKEGLLTPKLKVQNEKSDKLKKEENTDNSNPQILPESQNSFSKRLTNELGQNITLNINIQLTIPESENEKVYENFFQAMKKHLLS